MRVSYIDHDEATIQSFMRDPEYAAFYLNAVQADGDLNEARRVRAWVDEAIRRADREALVEA